MKKMLMIMLCAGFCIVACEQKNSQESADAEAMKEEIMTLDSAATAAEKVANEISESAENLDAILEEL